MKEYGAPDPYDKDYPDDPDMLSILKDYDEDMRYGLIRNPATIDSHKRYNDCPW